VTDLLLAAGYLNMPTGKGEWHPEPELLRTTRFYGGWWQLIPGDYRVFITINSNWTVQLDYSGMHFAIMYAALDMDIPMEPPLKPHDNIFVYREFS
jgi:hypothetical protein